MSRPTFYRKYAEGTAPRTTRYGRRIFVTEEALEEYLAQHSETGK
jgi:predicted DNA-binding transcriptional regulator AlpA